MALFYSPAMCHNCHDLKQIQDWLGHSDFAITANIYAHLDFSAKHATAGAMSWLDETSLVVEQEAHANENTSQDDIGVQALPDFIHSLFASGVSADVVQSWLKQADFTSGTSLTQNFHEFLSRESA